eukprot:3324966-Heterocapsa_arctica.AAC.1
MQHTILTYELERPISSLKSTGAKKCQTNRCQQHWLYMTITAPPFVAPPFVWNQIVTHEALPQHVTPSSLAFSPSRLRGFCLGYRPCRPNR